MSACSNLLELQEKICYVQCGFCNTILLVSVPCSSLSKVVTVRCGHCTCLLSVNMMRASFVPLQFLTSVDDEQKQEVRHEDMELQKAPEKQSPSLLILCENDEEEENLPTPIINKPPEKRQRAPSAYNRFIKEEIQRLKVVEPNMTHKEAFSTAAKNWAHFPRLQHRENGESCSAFGRENVTTNSDVNEVDAFHAQDKGFHGRTTTPWSQSAWTENHFGYSNQS
ncbi:hypothetical protein MKW92_024097 [Papaver armeniacum]|nr:hypothetical protein MKW92_024097 [Papaver armeniacum]